MGKRVLVKMPKKRGVTTEQFYTGVYSREHSTRRLQSGEPDLCFEITYKDGQGKLVWEKIGWASEGYSAPLAVQTRNDRIQAVRKGEPIPKKGEETPQELPPGEPVEEKVPTFGLVWEKYVEWATANKTRQGKDDINRYKNHIQPRFEETPLDEVSPFDLERVKSDLMKDGLAPATTRHVLVLIRQLYNKARAWGLYDGYNPVSKVTLPRLNNARQRFLSFDEAKALLAHLKKVSPNLHDMACLSLYCGLRASEIFNLRGHDIDLQNGIITVSDPKNRESRKAFMTETVKAILKARKTVAPNDYLFVDRRHNGKVTEISGAFDRAVKKLQFNAGVDDPRQRVCFHTLRHTFASWLALQGESLLTIRELLGHKSLEMVRRYAHLVPDEKRKATLRLERAFEEGISRENAQ